MHCAQYFSGQTHSLKLNPSSFSLRDDLHHEGHLRLSISHHAMSQTLVKKAHLAWRLSGKVDDDDD